MLVDFFKVMFNDFVEDFVKEEFGYGEKEFVISMEVGIIYDFDEMDNLEKKLFEFGMFFCFVIYEGFIGYF